MPCLVGFSLLDGEVDCVTCDSENARKIHPVNDNTNGVDNCRFLLFESYCRSNGCCCLLFGAYAKLQFLLIQWFESRTCVLILRALSGNATNLILTAIKP